MLSNLTDKKGGVITNTSLFLSLTVTSWWAMASSAIAQNTPATEWVDPDSIPPVTNPDGGDAPEQAKKGFEGCEENADTLGGMLLKLLDIPDPVIILILVIFGIAGAWFVVKGLIGLTKEGQQANIPQSVLQVVIGGLVISLGFMINMATVTLGFEANSTAVSNFSDAMVSCVMSGGSGTRDIVIANFATNVAQPLMVVVYVFSAILGIVMVGSALYQLPSTASPSMQGPTVPSLLARITIGVLLINLYGMSQMLTATAFNSEMTIAGANCSALSYSNHIDARGAVKSLADCLTGESLDIERYAVGMQRVIYYTLIPFGLIAFVSGLMAINAAAQGRQQQNGGGYKGGAVRIIAGVIMINMSTFVCTAEKTFGTEFTRNSYCTKL